MSTSKKQKSEGHVKATNSQKCKCWFDNRIHEGNYTDSMIQKCHICLCVSGIQHDSWHQYGPSVNMCYMSESSFICSSANYEN